VDMAAIQPHINSGRFGVIKKTNRKVTRIHGVMPYFCHGRVETLL
jgi:hypothetical protein